MLRVVRIIPQRIPGTEVWVHDALGARWEGMQLDEVDIEADRQAAEQRAREGAPPDMVYGPGEGPLIDPTGGPNGAPCLVFESER